MKWFYNLKIAVKLLTGFILVALIAGIVGGIGVMDINSINQDYYTMYEENTVPLKYIEKAAVAFQRMRVNIYTIISIDDGFDTYVDKIETYDKEVNDNLAQYEKFISTEEEKKEFDSISSMIEKYAGLRTECMNLALENKDQEAFALSQGELGDLAPQIDDSISQLYDINLNQAGKIADANSKKANESVIMMLIFIALGMLMSIGFGLFISRIISRPIRKMVDAVDKLAAGDVDVNIEVDTKDEVGILMQAFARMVNSIQEQAAVAENIAEGRLGIEIKPKSEKDVLNIRLGEMLQVIKRLISEMNKMYELQKLGDNEAFIDTEQFKGAYREVADGVNNGYKLHIGIALKILTILSSYAEGDFSTVLEKLPGKQAVANEKMDLLRGNLLELINETVSLSGAATEGNLAVRGDTDKFSGDYRKIISGINDTLEAIIQPINETASVLEEVAKGNLQVGVKSDYKGDYAVIKNAINDTITSFNEVLGNINSAAEQVASGAKQVSASGMALSQGSTEQASSVEELTSSIEEISSQTELNAQNAGQAKDLAETARVNAVQGNNRMKEMLKAMDEINDSSGNISKIIKVIDEIAFQTNILALNAAVEAARAGQHGKGFAVVAEEVRNLAARSASAAKETTDMIEGSIRKVEDGTKIANETATALDKIVDGVAKAASLVSDISTASNDQAIGIAQVTQGLSQVSQVVQTNSATSQESAAASEELSSQAELLKEQVSRFKLKRNDGSFKGSDELSPEVLRMLENMSERKVNPQSNKETHAGAPSAKTRIVLSDNEFGKY